MIERYKRLADRLRNELPDLGREVQRAQKSWSVAQTAADPDPYVDSVALNLHGFYSGCERLLELIAGEIDEFAPGGEAWHRELLDQMARPLPEVRPAVIRPETAAALDEFRKFRHLVRNVYTARLAPTRMQPLVASLPAVWTRLQADLSDFAELVDQLSHADEGPESAPVE